MADFIKKIDLIRNMAVFQDFHWKASVRDKGNNVADFKKINIFYGRNYSGKTTLSRIFRAMETGFISDKYVDPEFQLSFEDGGLVTQNSLINHGQIIRVFNEDFVKENLRFIVDDEHAINSFAILGENNNDLEEQIKRYEVELGSEEAGAGLIGKAMECNKAYQTAEQVYKDRSSRLENKLRDKANNTDTGIKHNKVFGDANYNINKIKNDIDKVCSKDYCQVTSQKIENFQQLLKEGSKQSISEPPQFKLSFSDFAIKVAELIEKKIPVSGQIQELLNDTVLDFWVRDGRNYHEGKRSKCAFCGGELSSALWEKLDKHFDKESENLRASIEFLTSSINDEKARVSSLLVIRNADFYSNFNVKLDQLRESLAKYSGLYLVSLDNLISQLDSRKSNIFSPLVFVEPTSCMQELLSVRDDYEVLREKSNQFTDSLSAKQLEAKTALRLHEIFIFVRDVNYIDECRIIESLKENFGLAEKAKRKAEAAVKDKEKQINELKAQLKDESKGADKVNDYLNHFFGHRSLSLEAIKEFSNGASTVYRFEVTRNGKKAYHLSEGECSLIAFCYFMAKLEDLETKGKQPIIWIDDPISSLDANHIFFIYSLINSEIVTSEKCEESGQNKERERFSQLFISTHNLDFLKYLKQLPGALNKNKSQYFIVDRLGQQSKILLMPSYLKEYVTEFNFLFHQIYKCAHAQIEHEENHDCYYNFGNNARKFLEAFLYYKYPNIADKDDKLLRFFGDDVLASSLTNRVNNEFSHLINVFERGMRPIDIPEMKTAANFILNKIQEKDPDQYEALLQSIGESRVREAIVAITETVN